MTMAYASIDPRKCKMGACEARRLIEKFGVKGFKFHQTTQATILTKKWPGRFMK